MKNQKQQGSAHLVIIVILVIALIAALGVVFYQNFIQKDKGESYKITTSKQADVVRSTPVAMKQFVSKSHGVTFNYPSNWSTAEMVHHDDTDSYSSTTQVKDSDGTVVAVLETGMQLGGACDPASPQFQITTLNGPALSNSGVAKASYSSTIVHDSDGAYRIAYGVTSSPLPSGTSTVQCPSQSVNFSYKASVDGPLQSLSFGKWYYPNDASYRTLADAETYLQSAAYKQVEQMIESLKIPAS